MSDSVGNTWQPQKVLISLIWKIPFFAFRDSSILCVCVFECAEYNNFAKFNKFEMNCCAKKFLKIKWDLKRYECISKWEAVCSQFYKDVLKLFIFWVKLSSLNCDRDL